ncbi:MAG: AAA family ATPase [Alphaproteobacteria bacterium]|nr:AAA family ATPase [Alphaproteobacteria bacterium]
MKSIAFFNNKGGVGKTSLVYHLGWMFAELGYRVLLVDLDPQANLTNMCISSDMIDENEENWSKITNKGIYHAVRPLIEQGISDITEIDPIKFDQENNLYLIPGDLELSKIEDQLSREWTETLSSHKNERAFRVSSAFYRVIQNTASNISADLVLIDIGPNLGAINRCALIGADYVITPMAPDLFSMIGLKNLGPSLREWRIEWKDRLSRKPENTDFSIPPGNMEPLGYVISRHSVRAERPVRSFQKWIARIPDTYAKTVLEQNTPNFTFSPDDKIIDPNCLGTIKDYLSLMAMAHEARKPVFNLKTGDGAIGSHQAAVTDCRKAFKELALEIARRINLPPKLDL